MGSGGLKHVLGPLQTGLGIVATAAGSPALGIPLMAGGIGQTAGSFAGAPGIGEAAGLGAGLLGEGAAGMGPLGGVIPGMLPQSVAGSLAQNTALPGPSAVQNALNANPLLQKMTTVPGGPSGLGAFNPADVLTAARGPQGDGGGMGLGAGGPTWGQALTSPLAGQAAGALMNPQQPQMPQMPQRPAPQAPPQQASMMPPIPPPLQLMAMPGPGPFPGTPPGPQTPGPQDPLMMLRMRQMGLA